MLNGFFVVAVVCFLPGFTLDSPAVRPKESYIEFLLVILIYVFLTIKV